MNGKPLKVCPNCEAYRHIAVKLCSICGYQFPTKADKVTRRKVLDYVKRKANIRDAKYPDGKPWEVIHYPNGVKPKRKYVKRKVNIWPFAAKISASDLSADTEPKPLSYDEKQKIKEAAKLLRRNRR